jgi:polyisoprenoid-binding protein YceI
MKKFLAISTFVLATTSSSFATDYKVDPDHTKISFKVRHLGISWVPGTFSKLDGVFSFDEKNIEASKAKANIEVASVNTENKKRDDHLKGEEFFAGEKYPAISFVSTGIKDVSGNKFTVIGDLTMHGVTKSVELSAEYNGSAKDPWGNDRAAFSATTKLNRKDFGLQWSKVLETGALVVGEDVLITIDVEGIKAK